MAVPAFLLTAGALVGYAKIFWDTIGKDLAKAYGPDIVKAAWAKFNGDNSQDSKLVKIDKKRMADLNQLAKVREDITEYRIRKEAQEEDASGKKPYLDNSYKKQNEKALNNLEKSLAGYYKQYPGLENLVTNKRFNEAQDVLKNEIGTTEQQANEAIKAIKEGRDQGQVTQPGIEQQRFQQYTPEQQQAMSELLKTGLSDIQSKKFDFGPIEEQARAGFTQKTIPTIAERFTQFGGPGAASAQRSSAFPQLLSQAGSDLEKSLAAMKQGYNLQQQGQLANLLQLGLKPQYAHAGPLISGLGNQQPSNIDKFAEYLPTALLGTGNFLSNLFNKKDQAAQAQSQELSSLKNKLGGSYQALQAVYPEAFKDKTVLPQQYNPANVNNMEALKALYPQAFGQTGIGNQTIEDALSGLGQTNL